MRALVATTYAPFAADRRGPQYAERLAAALRQHGAQTDLVLLPLDPASSRLPPQLLALQLLDLSETSGARNDRLICLTSAACALQHPDKVAWLVGDDGLGRPGPAVRWQRERPPAYWLAGQARTVYAPSRRVAERLWSDLRLRAEGTVYPPHPEAERFRAGEQGDYFLILGPIAPRGRQRLALEALAWCDRRIRLVIAGPADQPSYLQALRTDREALDLAARTVFYANPSLSQQVELLAGALAVLYLGWDEERYDDCLTAALPASRPIVALADAGAATEVVRSGWNGLVVQPTARELARALDHLFRDRRGAAQLARGAADSVAELGLTWARAAERLLT